MFSLLAVVGNLQIFLQKYVYELFSIIFNSDL